MKAKNSKIENKIDTLTNNAFVNKQTTEDKIANIDRMVRKITDQIKLEKEYSNDIGSDKK